MSFVVNAALSAQVESSADGVDPRSAAVERGLQLLERVVQNVPGLMDAHLRIAKAKNATGDWPGAIRALNAVRG